MVHFIKGVKTMYFWALLQKVLSREIRATNKTVWYKIAFNLSKLKTGRFQK